MSKDVNAIDVLLLIARPAAGKSEIIDYLKKVDAKSRLQRFHLRDFEEIDDFPMLWTWFEEDALLERMGYPRLHTDEEGYFIESYLWDLLVERICLAYEKKQRDMPDYHDHHSTLIEFSRGKEHGGFQQAFSHLSDAVLKRMAILYIDVSWQESLRKNRKRFNPDRPDSILEHGLPDEKMERLYRESDWDEIRSRNSKTIQISGYSIPYSVFENEDDVTTAGGAVLGERLERCMQTLWELYRKEQNFRRS